MMNIKKIAGQSLKIKENKSLAKSKGSDIKFADFL